MQVLAIFGPTAVGKTEVAVEVAELLRKRGERPVAVNCDSIQVYRGLEALSGAPTAIQRRALEHRFVSFVEMRKEFSAGRFAELARAEIDDLLEAGRRPIVVGGTGLYLRAALSEMELQDPVPVAVRAAVEVEVESRGAPALHAELPPDVAATVHPNDRKRVARATELQRAGTQPPAGAGGLWTARLRHPTLLAGLVLDRDELAERIAARAAAMVGGEAREEARRALTSGASRTAAAALGVEELLAGDADALATAHRAYARRQLTWMRRMEGVTIVDRTGRSDADVAREIVGLLG